MAIDSKYFTNPDSFKHLIPEELGKKILINPTDAYASYTYRLTFSMLPYTFYSTGKVDLNLESGGRIIIAQTSVTKFQIDNLEISSVVHPSPPAKLRGNNNSKYRINFDLQEPFGMSFIDLLNRTSYELNKDLNFPEDKPPLQMMPYLLEIELIGYPDDKSYTDSEPAFGETFYHTAIPCRVVDFNIDPGVSGTAYSVQAVTISEIIRTAGPQIKKVPEEINISTPKDGNGTVNELLDSFTTQMQGLQNAVVSSAPNKDIGVETGIYRLDEENGLPGFPKIFSRKNSTKGLAIDEEYFTANGMAGKNLKSLENNSTVGEIVEEDTAGQGDTSDDGQNKSLILTVKKGALVEDVLRDLASLNSEYCNTVHRFDMAKESAELDPETFDKDKTQTLTPSIRKTYSWDQKFTKDNKMAFTHTYTLTGKLDSTLVMDKVELQVDGKNEQTNIRKAAEDRFITKFYGYFYTGINDQVYDIDLKIQNGVRYLMPGYGGKQANYTQSPAAAISQAGVEKIDEFKKKEKPTTKDLVLEKFIQLSNDLKSIVTQLATLPITLTQDLAALATGLNPIGITPKKVGDVRKLNLRLPSSPVAIIQKSKTITGLTSSLDSLTSNIQNLQDEIQGELASALESQIADIMSKAFTPFDVIDSAFNKIAEGVGGFINEIESAVGDLDIVDQFGIDTTGLLDEARDKIDEFTTAVNNETPSGFSDGTQFGSVTNSIVDLGSLYMEEFEFDENAMGYNDFNIGTPFGQYSTDIIKELVGPASKFANRSIFSTQLSNSSLGAPYLVNTSLTIKGDPFWLGKQMVDDNKKFEYIQGKDFLGDLESDIGAVREESVKTNTAPYGIGEVGFFFTYLFPRDYDTWSDDPSTHTGEMKDLSMNKSFSGQFTPYRVTHMFAGGSFKQQLEAYKVVYKGQMALEVKKEKEISDQLSQTLANIDMSVPAIQFDANGQIITNTASPLENAINNITFTESDFANAGYVNPLSIDNLDNDGGG